MTTGSSNSEKCGTKTWSTVPRVSVIVPVRDDAEGLRRCLASIAANGYEGHVEVIVVDNGSRDHSVTVARDSGATVFILPDCCIATLRNAGAAHATGDILAFVDADHAIDEAWIAAAADVLAAPEIGATGAPCVPPSNGNWVQSAYDRFRSHRRGVHQVEWLGSGNLAVRRHAFVEVGEFDTSLETCEDVDLCNRLRSAGYRIVSDDRMRSIHFGDPATITALFIGELWRGRDNVRTTLRGPITLRSLPSLVIPFVNLFLIAAIIAGAIAAPRLGPGLLIGGVGGLVFLSICRAAQMMLTGQTASLRDLGPNLAVASVYNVARALALVLRATHRRHKSAAV